MTECEFARLLSHHERPFHSLHTQRRRLKASTFAFESRANGRIGNKNSSFFHRILHSHFFVFIYSTKNPHKLDVLFPSLHHVSSHFTLPLICFLSGYGSRSGSGGDDGSRWLVMVVGCLCCCRSSERISIFHLHSFSAFTLTWIFANNCGMSKRTKQEKSAICIGKGHFKQQQQKKRKLEWSDRHWLKSRATRTKTILAGWGKNTHWKWQDILI